MASRNARRRKAKATAKAHAERRAKAHKLTHKEHGIGPEPVLVPTGNKTRSQRDVEVSYRQVKSSIQLVKDSMPVAKGGGYAGATRRGKVVKGKLVPDYGFLPRFSQR